MFTGCCGPDPCWILVLLDPKPKNVSEKKLTNLQCCGSESADPHFCLIDPDPDSAIFVSDLKMAGSKKLLLFTF